MKIAVVCLLVSVLCMMGTRSVSADTPATVTSKWHVVAWIGENAIQDTLTMQTTGTKVVGQFHGNAITGTLVNDGAQLNGDWTGPRGTGWITLHFHNENNGFSGTWGQKSKPADGQFVGKRIEPSPSPSQ